HFNCKLFTFTSVDCLCSIISSSNQNRIFCQWRSRIFCIVPFDLSSFCNQICNCCAFTELLSFCNRCFRSWVNSYFNCQSVTFTSVNCLRNIISSGSQNRVFCQSRSCIFRIIPFDFGSFSNQISNGSTFTEFLCFYSRKRRFTRCDFEASPVEVINRNSVS